VLSRLRKCDRIEICAIVRSSRTFHPAFGFLRGALAYFRRSGFAYSLYLFCTTTLADLLCAFTPIGCVPLRTSRKGIPVHTTRDINDADGLGFLRGCAPDLIVSAFFDQRLQEAALSVPARGCLNIHPSLLPSFRGVDPVLQARLHGVAPLGVTVHYMAPALDTGNILAQCAMTVPERATIFETTALLFCEGAELLVSQIDCVETGGTGAAQRAGGSYQSWPTRADIRGLRTLGYVLIRLTDVTRFLTSAGKALALRHSRDSFNSHSDGGFQ
jgi:folate-dependent phosphoribosylglycinamide formyltransferase PurN